MKATRIKPSGIGDGIIGAIEVAFTLLLSPFIRSWYNRWGATADEIGRALPGDDLVPTPRQRYTRAITINASSDAIWPWLAQMGQGRGGLYSYDWLENLIGCDIHSVDWIVPAFQDLQVGDAVRLGQKGILCSKSFPLSRGGR